MSREKGKEPAGNPSAEQIGWVAWARSGLSSAASAAANVIGGAANSVVNSINPDWLDDDAKKDAMDFDKSVASVANTASVIASEVPGYAASTVVTVGGMINAGLGAMGVDLEPEAKQEADKVMEQIGSAVIGAVNALGAHESDNGKNREILKDYDKKLMLQGIESELSTMEEIVQPKQKINPLLIEVSIFSLLALSHEHLVKAKKLKQDNSDTKFFEYDKKISYEEFADDAVPEKKDVIKYLTKGKELLGNIKNRLPNIRQNQVTEFLQEIVKPGNKDKSITDKIYGGSGFIAEKNENGELVIKADPNADSPAGRAGLKKGDVITHIGAQDVKVCNMEHIISMLRGDVGDKRTFTLNDGREVNVVLAAVKNTSKNSGEYNIEQVNFTQPEKFGLENLEAAYKLGNDVGKAR